MKSFAFIVFLSGLLTGTFVTTHYMTPKDKGLEVQIESCTIYSARYHRDLICKASDGSTLNPPLNSVDMSNRRADDCYGKNKDCRA